MLAIMEETEAKEVDNSLASVQVEVPVDIDSPFFDFVIGKSVGDHRMYSFHTFDKEVKKAEPVRLTRSLPYHNFAVHPGMS